MLKSTLLLSVAALLAAVESGPSPAGKSKGDGL